MVHGNLLPTAKLVKEIKILFPEVNEIAVGKIQTFYTLDSTGVETAFLYKTDSKIDEPKLKSWLENKLKSNKIILVNTKTFSK